MATKKDIKEFLKETNITSEIMDIEWQKLLDIQHKFAIAINNMNKGWRDIAIHQIKQIPEQYDKTLKIREEVKLKEEREEQERIKEKKEREYYLNHFEEIMYYKICNNIDLTEEDLKMLIHETKQVDVIEHDENRWTRTMETIVMLNNKLFSIIWSRGLTESQENGYYNQPVEVKEVTKTITVKEYVQIEK